MERNWEAAAERLAGYIHQMVEGDTYMMDDMFEFLLELGYADKDGFDTIGVEKD